MSFLTVPLYTSILTAEQYANIDIIILLTQLVTPIFSLSIFDAVIRFCMDKNYNQDVVFTKGLSIVLASTVVIIVFTPVMRFFDALALKGNEIAFILMYFSGALSSTVSYFIRAIDKVRVIVVSSILSTAVNLLLGVFLIRQFRLGEDGYYLSLIISNFSGVVYMVLACKLWRNIKFEKKKTPLLKEMLRYSLPLTPNSICWWINSSINRLILNGYVSKTELGLYSASNKIPSVLSLVTSTFQQAWTLSSINTYEENKENQGDGSAFYKQVFEIYDLILVAASMVMITFSHLIATIMLKGDFINGWVYIPLLIIGFYFNSLNAFAGSILTALKKTKIIFTSTFFAAIINIACGFLLVKSFSGHGATISMAIGYAVMWGLRNIILKKEGIFKIDVVGSLINYLVLILAAVSNLKCQNYNLLVQVLLYTVLVINNRKKLIKIPQIMSGILNKKRNQET